MNDQFQTAVTALHSIITANAPGLLGVVLFVLFAKFAASLLGRN